MYIYQCSSLVHINKRLALGLIDLVVIELHLDERDVGGQLRALDGFQEPFQRGRGVVLLPQEELAHVGGRDRLVRERFLELREEVVIVEAQVVLRERAERRERAPRHEDALVHAAGAEQRGVQLLDEVGGEDEEALRSAARPQAVREV